MARTTGNLGFVVSGGSAGGVIVTQAVATPATIDISSSSGATLDSWKSVTFVVANGSIRIGGITFGIGVYTFDNNPSTLNAITYDATGSTDTKLLIIS